MNTKTKAATTGLAAVIGGMLVIGSAACSNQAESKPGTSAQTPGPALAEVAAAVATKTPSNSRGVEIPVNVGGRLANDGTPVQIGTLDDNPRILARGTLTCSKAAARIGGLMPCDDGIQSVQIPLGVQAVEFIVAGVPVAAIKVPPGADPLLHRVINIP